MVNIYRLQYASKAEALKDLKSKKVINAKGQYINCTESVVECGIITLVYATETEDNECNHINGTEALVECNIINDGYHYNIMTTDTVIFDSEVFPKNAKYKFGGHE